MLIQDELEAAALVADFTQELAQKLACEHPSIQFSAHYSAHPYTAQQPDTPANLLSYFRIDAKGEALVEEFIRADERRRPHVEQWVPILYLSLECAVAQDQQKRYAHCMLYLPRLVPGFLRTEIEHFLSVTFGCKKVFYVEA